MGTLPVVPVPTRQGCWEQAQYELPRHGLRRLAWLGRVIRRECFPARLWTQLLENDPGRGRAWVDC